MHQGVQGICQRVGNVYSALYGNQHYVVLIDKLMVQDNFPICWVVIQQATTRAWNILVEPSVSLPDFTLCHTTES